MSCHSGCYHNDHKRKRSCECNSCCTRLIALLPGIVSAATTTVTQATQLSAGIALLPPALTQVINGLNGIEAGFVGIGALANAIIANAADPAAVANLASQINAVVASGVNATNTLEAGVNAILTGSNQLVTASTTLQASAQTTLDLVRQAQILGSTC